MLVGVPGAGKTAAAHAVARTAGAAFLDLSPRNTDGKYPGKAAAVMVRMAMRAARLLAPSVIYIDECEKASLAMLKSMDTPNERDSTPALMQMRSRRGWAQWRGTYV